MFVANCRYLIAVGLMLSLQQRIPLYTLWTNMTPKSHVSTWPKGHVETCLFGGMLINPNKQITNASLVPITTQGTIRNICPITRHDNISAETQ